MILAHWYIALTSLICLVHTASYGSDQVFFFLLWPKHEERRPWKQARKKRGSITCHTDQANEANKMFIIWLFLLFWERNEIVWHFDKWSRARGPYSYLRTSNWPITAREISQSYNEGLYWWHREKMYIPCWTPKPTPLDSEYIFYQLAINIDQQICLGFFTSRQFFDDDFNFPNLCFVTIWSKLFQFPCTVCEAGPIFVWGLLVCRMVI